MRVDAPLLAELVDGVEDKLARIEIEVSIPEERTPKVFVYPDREQMLAAMLFPQKWTGAVAYPSYNIILGQVTPSNIEWAKVALAHEITHLIVGEAVFGPFGDIPTWLNEGLAQYAEGAIEESQLQLVDEAAEAGQL